MRILIVDADPLDRQIVKRALDLGTLSCELIEAESFEEGVACYQKGRIDMVMVDYHLPEKGGVEMLIMLSDLGEHSAAMVVMSNAEDEDIASHAILAGAHDFILKTDISVLRLRRAILHARARFELERKLHDSHEKLKQLAERDTLTGLANRYLFDESLKVLVANNRKRNGKVALLLVDLDNLKHVNDNFGHDVGDVLLQRVVQRINSCLRGNELFARLGGDEFAIALSNLECEHEASRVAQRIVRVLEKPFSVNGRSFTSSASIGIAINPDNGTTPESLLKHADIAMYRAKKMGKRQAYFFTDEMQLQFISRFEIEQQLREALDKKQFTLKYQPIYASGTHVVDGFEALLEWNNPDGLRNAEEYLAVAEETKLIVELGNWSIENAIAQQVDWRERVGIAYHMSINLSPFQLLSSALGSDILKYLDKYKANAEDFVFEITEFSLQGAESEVLQAIETIRALGCRVALDDFGAGTSSISHLKKYPIDIVKLDRRFLPDETSSERDVALFKSVVGMIKSLDINLTVVGTETIEQVELCVDLNVSHLQGFFFARPEEPSYVEEHFLARVAPNLTD